MKAGNWPLLRTRLLYLTAAVFVLVMGLASRGYRDQLPAFLSEYTGLAEYAGDTLWALMLFLLVSTLLAGCLVSVRAAVALALAFSIEFSQLYHAPWIDSIRQTTLGGLVLGFGFLWTDLACYSAGIALGSFAVWGSSRLFAPKPSKLPGKLSRQNQSLD